DLCLQRRLRAVEARPKSRIDRRTLNGIAEPSGRNEGVLLCVDTNAYVVSDAGLVSLSLSTSDASSVQTLPHDLRGFVLARRDDAISSDKDRADFAAKAVRLTSNGDGDAHVVLVLRQARLRPLL